LTDTPDLQNSAEAISIEIGLDISYFTDESERNFFHIPLALGYLLLKWFIEGCVIGAGEATVERSARAGGIKRLSRRVKQLFGGGKATAAGDTVNEQKLASEAQAAVIEARKVLSNRSAEELTSAADAYEQALVGYLTDNGMPVRDAIRIAQRVRAEATLQLYARRT
jgi:hypothetical protein